MINDGSDDDTGDVLASIAGADLEVLTRVAPMPGSGKRQHSMRPSSTWNGRSWPTRVPRRRSQPGDLRHRGCRRTPGPEAPATVARHFDDPEVGGVQVHVHIYNQTVGSPACRAGVPHFRGLYQVGTLVVGTAFLGGNGQFNRMTALRSVAGDEGPWSHYLTEDQELGLRCLAHGWRGEHEPNTQVAQQGLNDLRRLYGKGVRWFQGNLQVLKDFGRLNGPRLHGIRRLDVAISLGLPILQMIVGLALVLAIVLAVFFNGTTSLGIPAAGGVLRAVVGGTHFPGCHGGGRGRVSRAWARRSTAAIPYLLYVADVAGGRHRDLETTARQHHLGQDRTRGGRTCRHLSPPLHRASVR